MKTEPTESLKNLIREVFDAYDSDGHDIENIVDYESAEKAVRSAFGEGQSSPKIKKLEWKEGYENFHGRKSYFAKTPFSPYEVAEGGDHYIMFSPDKRLRFASANEAKAAAQRDFEKKVKECLE